MAPSDVALCGGRQVRCRSVHCFSGRPLPHCMVEGDHRQHGAQADSYKALGSVHPAGGFELSVSYHDSVAHRDTPELRGSTVRARVVPDLHVNSRVDRARQGRRCWPPPGVSEDKRGRLDAEHESAVRHRDCRHAAGYRGQLAFDREASRQSGIEHHHGQEAAKCRQRPRTVPSRNQAERGKQEELDHRLTQPLGNDERETIGGGTSAREDEEHHQRSAREHEQREGELPGPS